jgi:hypothetical protein
VHCPYVLGKGQVRGHPIFGKVVSTDLVVIMPLKGQFIKMKFVALLKCYEVLAGIIINTIFFLETMLTVSC